MLAESRLRYGPLALILLLWLGDAPAIADEPARGRDASAERKEARKRRRQAARRKARAEAQKRAREKKPAAAKDDSAAERAAAQLKGSRDGEVVKEGDTLVKVMRFEGLSLEGRVRSPQLLYFVNRVRAELDRPRLPHRSFMPELERSTHEEPVR